MLRQVGWLGAYLVITPAAIAAEAAGCAPSEAGGYVLRDATALHQSPQETSPVSARLPSGDRLVASCRVQGPAGEWWLKVEEAGGAVGYVLESATAKAAASSAAKIEAEPEKRSRDPLLQGRY